MGWPAVGVYLTRHVGRRMKRKSAVTSIDHVFVLMLENRSFDHMLGFSAITGTDAQSGAKIKIRGLSGAEANSYKGTAYSVSPAGAPPVMPVDPGHEFEDVLEQLCGENPPYKGGRPYPKI